MSYDPALGGVILFGGYPCGAIAGPCDDTWEFNHDRWTELFPLNSPTPRWGAAMTFDAADDVLLLFGGAGCIDASCQSLGLLQDTWEFLDGDWIQVNTTGVPHPPAGEEGEMAYDPYDGYVVLFGGCSSYFDPVAPYPPYQSDTWSFRAGVWTSLTSSIHTSPTGWCAGGLVNDLAEGDLVLLGGTCESGEIWTFESGQWTESVSIDPVSISSPTPTQFSGFAYDATDEYAVMVGGTEWQNCGPNTTPGIIGATPQMNTWVYAEGSWTSFSPSPSPGGGVATFDAADGFVFLFTGSSSWTFGGPIQHVPLLSQILPFGGNLGDLMYLAAVVGGGSIGVIIRSRSRLTTTEGDDSGGTT
jgi:hypothetical protein